MIPSANAAAWRPPASRRRAALRSSLASRRHCWSRQYLAGYFLLWSLKGDPRGASR